jgi:hypothetical protein
MAKESRGGASLYERAIVAKARLLTVTPKQSFMEEILVTFAVTLCAGRFSRNGQRHRGGSIHPPMEGFLIQKQNKNSS